MKTSEVTVRLAAIAAGAGLLLAGTALAYWQISRRYWCVRTVSTGSQEVTYSWGCLQPQRYKQWSIIASVDQPADFKALSFNLSKPKP